MSQCKTTFQWESDAPTSCLGIKFGGTLGADTKQGCLEESVCGYQMMLWNRKNSNDDLLQCLKHHLEIDEGFEDGEYNTSDGRNDCKPDKDGLLRRWSTGV